MGKGPSPPDPYATANAQQNANYLTSQQNTIMGNVNEYTPYGSKTYNQIGWDPVYDSRGKQSWAPRYSSTVNLSPDQQELLRLQTGAQKNLGNLAVNQSGRLQSLLGKEMSTSGLQGWQAARAPGAIRQDQGPTDRGQIEKAMMASYNRSNDPQVRAQEAQLAARGLSPGSQGYGGFQQGVMDARGEAARQAYLASGQESRAAQEAYNAAAQQKYQMGTDWAAQLNNLRQGQLTERIALRNQPINEIMALMGGSGPSTPSFQPFAASPMSAPNIGQMIYDNYNARAQQSSNNMQGLFGIGSAVAGALPWASMLSDRRLKTDIKPTGQQLAGVPLYFFRYRRHKVIPKAQWHTPHVGVMADEVRNIHPDAVIRLSDGYDRVDYGLLTRRETNG